MQVNFQVESDTKPNKFCIENMLNGKCDIIINDDIRKVLEHVANESEEHQREKYVYNSYRITTNYRENLEDELNSENEFEKWVTYVRQQYYNEKAEEIRKIRNELLEKSDKYMCIDRLGIELPENITTTNLLSVIKTFFAGLGNAINGNYAKYRQELRDITEQPGFPYDVEFPEEPNKEAGC